MQSGMAAEDPGNMAAENRKIVIFGAGNIGRSFIGQVFSRGGWNVVFIDVDRTLVDALNERGGYDVVIKKQGAADRIIRVSGVSAIDGRDAVAVAHAVAGADCLACSVGKSALPRILPPIAAGLLERERETLSGPSVHPLDLILAENDREAPETVRSGLSALLPTGFPLEARLGLVETSIGKMVPIIKKEDVEADRLRVFAEEYNSLIVDRHGFLGQLPDVPDLKPVDDILAYVDRKLFIHNLGHAAVAWIGHTLDPDTLLIAQALKLPGVREAARSAMEQSAAALVATYPAAYTRADLSSHIDDLLERFANEALGDTVFRVGRDLPRKLDRTDRVIGAALLCQSKGLPWDAIARVFQAALTFRAVDEAGIPFAADAAFHELLSSRRLQAVLRETCRLDPSDPVDHAVMEGLLSVVQAHR